MDAPLSPAGDRSDTSFLAPLRMRDFRRVATGQLVSSVDNAMYKVGQAWLLIGTACGGGALIGLLATFQLCDIR